MLTLDQCYQQNEGKALLIPGGGAGNDGQCVQWADTVLHEVYGMPYHWGNAIDWWLNPAELLNSFDKITDKSIKKGDFVIYNSGVGSEFGHIDVAAQDGSVSGGYVGWDSNWGKVYNAQGYPILHTVNHNDRYNQYILGSLRIKGEIMADKIDANLSKVLQHGILGRNGVAGRPYALDGSTGTPWVGGDLTAQFIMDIFNSPEARAWRDGSDPSSVNGINQQLADAKKGFTPVSQLYTKDK